ncbi:hypothetical protein EVAR_68100_1 [Eumeta japonica]|uniref:Uncharacterized protein n=1 Tax=Eumeta variegata TaxID=151549 RepID=A0A4C2A742_EUMVA|nr:hypothetical protein EVAR_68100_1 [Eumeta japonica]
MPIHRHVFYFQRRDKKLGTESRIRIKIEQGYRWNNDSQSSSSEVDIQDKGNHSTSTQGRNVLEGPGWHYEFKDSPEVFDKGHKLDGRCGWGCRRLGSGWQTPPPLYDQSDTASTSECRSRAARTAPPPVLFPPGGVQVRVSDLPRKIGNR